LDYATSQRKRLYTWMTFTAITLSREAWAVTTGK
jgi:hypothetical protein